MTSQTESKARMFTAKEIMAFQINVAVCMAVAAGMFFVAPPGVGQILGVAFAAALMPLPPMVIYLSRRHGRTK